MLDFLLLAAVSVALLFYPLDYVYVALIGALVGLFKGGLDVVFKLLFVAVAVVALPLVMSHYYSIPADIIYVAVSGAALTGGYVAGSLASVALLPVKFAGSLLKFIASMFKR
jgi:hydrogenase/urease accessory protein HupE